MAYLLCFYCPIQCFFSYTVLLLIFLHIWMNCTPFKLLENRCGIDSTIKSLQKTPLNSVRKRARPVFNHFSAVERQALCERFIKIGRGQS